jgi:four helix bundle protein
MGDGIAQFEDLEAWKEARRLVAGVYRLTAMDGLSRDFGIKDQIQRAAVSMMNNIAEGFERTSKAEKRHFYSIARASCGETRSLLYVIEDLFPAAQDSAKCLRHQAIKAGKLVTGLIRSTESRMTAINS